MIEYAEHVILDLERVKTTQQLLALLGTTFEFGGTKGNEGWGMNWNALADSLYYVDSGGIWGNSRIFALPLLVTVTNFAEYRRNDPHGFAILIEILQSTCEKYASAGSKFDFDLK